MDDGVIVRGVAMVASCNLCLGGSGGERESVRGESACVWADN